METSYCNYAISRVGGRVKKALRCSLTKRESIWEEILHSSNIPVTRGTDLFDLIFCFAQALERQWKVFAATTTGVETRELFRG